MQLRMLPRDLTMQQMQPIRFLMQRIDRADGFTVQTVTELRSKLSLSDWDRLCALTAAKVCPSVRSHTHTSTHTHTHTHIHTHTHTHTHNHTL